MTNADDKAEAVRRKAGAQTTWLEWAIAVLGGALLLAALGYMLAYAASTSDGPPELVVKMTGIQPQDGGFLVMFETDNQGGDTGASVVVSGILSDSSGAVLERSEAMLDFVPEHSRRSGGLLFSLDPRQNRLVLRVESYVEP